MFLNLESPAELVCIKRVMQSLMVCVCISGSVPEHGAGVCIKYASIGGV